MAVTIADGTGAFDPASAAARTAVLRIINFYRCARARASGIKVLQTMANTLEGHRTGILNWYDFPISNGRLEGINNKIGALQRSAYGYRDRDYFIAKLYALHLAKFALIG